MNFLDLFSGIGGFRRGLENAGMTCIGHCEIDKYANKSYNVIHDVKENEVYFDDITRITDNEWARIGKEWTIDLIAAGFPCQAFSIAGKREGFEDARGTLFFDLARAIKQIQPPYLLLENVKGLLSHDKGRTFGRILRILDELGYNLEWQVLNSKDFGVPQNRQRVFIIGYLRGRGGRKILPIRQDGKPFSEETERSKNTQRQICGTITTKFGSRGTDIYLKEIIGGSQGNRVYDPSGLSVTLSANGGGQGAKTGLYAMPVTTPDRVDKRQNGRRFKENNEPMFTLTTQDRHGVMIDDYRIRKLTPKECWRLQGFKDEDVDKAKAIGMSDTQLYKQAGNSVTVNVIEYLGKLIMESSKEQNNEKNVYETLISFYSLKDIAQADFEPVVDWSKVEVDTKVVVRNLVCSNNSGDIYGEKNMHFARYIERTDKIGVYVGGRTSWSGISIAYYNPSQVRLAEVE